MAKIIRQERPKTFSGERGDCGVHALSALLCIPYDEAHALLAAVGRSNGSGTWLHEMQAAILRAGFKYGKLTSLGRGFSPRTGRSSYPSTVTVLDHVPARGHFLMGSTHHWFAIVDGVIYDNGGLRNRARVRFSVEVFIDG